MEEVKQTKYMDEEPFTCILTIFIHSEVHHLPSILTQWLDDGRESVTSTWLLETILGATISPDPAKTPY